MKCPVCGSKISLLQDGSIEHGQHYYVCKQCGTRLRLRGSNWAVILFLLPVLVTGVAWAAALLVDVLLPQTGKSALGQLLPIVAGLGVLASVGMKSLTLEQTQ